MAAKKLNLRSAYLALVPVFMVGSAWAQHTETVFFGEPQHGWFGNPTGAPDGAPGDRAVLP